MSARARGTTLQLSFFACTCIVPDDGLKCKKADKNFLCLLLYSLPICGRTFWGCIRLNWKMRNNGEFYEQEFSHLVTDGVSICLGNAADWETAREAPTAFLIPGGTPGMGYETTLAESIMEKQAQ